MADARFKLDKAGIAVLLKSDGVKNAMTERAERIATRARQIAPVGDPATDRHSGEYRDGILVSSTNAGGAKGDRATAAVTATAAHSRYVEYVPDKDGVAHHTMLRAAVETRST
jgi:Bacteriophage HK97-gp10, putative tail-component